MTFNVELNASPAVELLRTIRSKVAAIREPIFAYARGPMRENVIDDVNELLAPYPEQSALHPFMFATVKSRAFYFWAMRQGFFDGQTWSDDDGGWQRTNNLHDSWQVEVNVSANEAFVTIYNDATNEFGDTYAQAVYGPDAVQGHIDTGWQQDFDDALNKIADRTTEDLLDALQTALTEY